MLLSELAEQALNAIEKGGDREVYMTATLLDDGYSASGSKTEGLSDVFDSTVTKLLPHKDKEGNDVVKLDWRT